MKQFLVTPVAILCMVLGLASRAWGVDPLETRAIVHTSFGDMTFVLWPTVAPITVLNFVKLSQEKFYDGTSFHRVVPKFVIQGGDPMSRTDSLNVGTGGPSYCIPAEFSQRPHLRGTLSMARRSTDQDSAGSQFFICLDTMPILDGHYSAFGQLVEGWDVLDKIGSVPVVYSPQGEPSRPLDRISITGVSTAILVPPMPESPKAAVESPKELSSPPQSPQATTPTTSSDESPATPKDGGAASHSMLPAPAKVPEAPLSTPAPDATPANDQPKPESQPQAPVAKPSSPPTQSASAAPPNESKSAADTSVPAAPSASPSAESSKSPAAPSASPSTESSKSPAAPSASPSAESSKSQAAPSASPSTESSKLPAAPTEKDSRQQGAKAGNDKDQSKEPQMVRLYRRFLPLA